MKSLDKAILEQDDLIRALAGKGIPAPMLGLNGSAYQNLFTDQLQSKVLCGSSAISPYWDFSAGA